MDRAPCQSNVCRLNVMTVAVFTLRFDGETEAAVRALSERLAEAGIPTGSLPLYRPHITLAAYDAADVGEYVSLLESFGRMGTPFPIHFDAIGIFPIDGVVFLAPRMSQALFSLHRRLLSHFSRPDLPPVADIALQADHWIPHCRLSAELSPAQVASAARLLQVNWQEITGTIEGIGLLVPPESEDRHAVTLGLRRLNPGRR